MTDLKVTQLSDLGGAPASDDLLMVVDVSDTSMSAAGTNKKVSAANLLGGVMTGGGTIATGGNTLTIPASGIAALLSEINAFTNKQTIDPVGGTTQALVINGPVGCSVDLFEVKLNTVARLQLSETAVTSQLQLPSFDSGTEGIGARFLAGQNTNASTPAAGVFAAFDKGGDIHKLWPDDSGVWRTLASGWPTNANDTAGTIVGAQTSSLDAKQIAGDPISIDLILAAIKIGAAGVRRFTYKNSAFNGEEFSGVVTDYAPRYGMDRDAEHPAGKSLNVITVIGDLLLTVANLMDRIELLEKTK